jgi:hypothetical protein
MLATKGLQVLAAGPYFAAPGDPVSFRRAMLVKNNRGSEPALVIVVKRMTPTGKPSVKLIKQLAHEDFTYAVRVFCDFILDQAVAADKAMEKPRQ